MFRNGHFNQGHFKAKHFGTVTDYVAKIFVQLAGVVKRIVPVIQFRKAKPVTEIKHEDQ